MSSNTWNKFVVRIDIKATPEEIYRSWATRKGMESWFLRLSEFKDANGNLRGPDELVEAGDSYTWLWHGWSDDTVERGEILAADGSTHLRFTFGKAGICTVTVKEEQGLPILELLQEDIPADDDGKYHWHVGCKTGWTFYLANLKSILEGGIDLRNKDTKLREVLNS